jgi:hypothetical protein
MTTPSTPIRKSADVETNSAGQVKGGNNANSPARQSAAPFGSVDKSVYKRPSVGITPGGVPVNDDDAGKGTGNVRSGDSSGGIKAWEARKDGAD